MENLLFQKTHFHVMVKFLSSTQLYETIQQKSKDTKEILWVCSPKLGSDAHEIFSQETIQHALTDVRFIFKINENSVKAGDVNPYELQFLTEHFMNINIRSLEEFNSTICVFDDSALVTSAPLTKSSFEGEVEAGVLLEGSEADQVKCHFSEILWENAKPIKDFKKLKKTWNHKNKSTTIKKRSKTKCEMKIKKWTDDSVRVWYFSILDPLPKNVGHKIRKEANWTDKWELVSDIGPTAFKQIKLGNKAFLADLTKKRLNTIPVIFARVFDKCRVETDCGDLHFAYEPEKTFPTDRNQFFEMLKNSGISPKNSEIRLTQEQKNLMLNMVSSVKLKKRARKKPKKGTLKNKT